MNPGELRASILGLLVTHGPVHISFLMDELDRNRRNIEITVARLIEEGFAYRPVLATYDSTPAGAKEVRRLQSLLAGELA